MEITLVNHIIYSLSCCPKPVFFFC